MNYRQPMTNPVVIAPTTKYGSSFVRVGYHDRHTDDTEVDVTGAANGWGNCVDGSDDRTGMEMLIEKRLCQRGMRRVLF